ncbi:hypothetical protein BOTBODRAFT_142507 [Botryobasidium botryosum FD-172 SS1]|uniref:Uncharacterized protein n=1 Tax=Botryobasidium botryosum (strain FD-172 SS1) TaxID=930990 RepID=A0A067N7R2_BOTB1|nr:hypothetical protein BOTBODRAFT_142507 [Botryobasidium botryosum FD-172 SS1]
MIVHGTVCLAASHQGRAGRKVALSAGPSLRARMSTRGFNSLFDHFLERSRSAPFEFRSARQWGCDDIQELGDAARGGRVGSAKEQGSEETTIREEGASTYRLEPWGRRDGEDRTPRGAAVRAKKCIRDVRNHNLPANASTFRDVPCTFLRRTISYKAPTEYGRAKLKCNHACVTSAMPARKEISNEEHKLA